MTAELRVELVSREHAERLIEMAEEFHAAGDARFDDVLEDIEIFFERTERFAAGRELPENRVQQTHFLLMHGDRILGSARLRHRLIPTLHRDGGNIGYEVRPNERGRGHASAMLTLMLDEARRIGLDRVLLTASPTNDASLRVIEKSGGVADGESVSPETGEPLRRYWIELG